MEEEVYEEVMPDEESDEEEETDQGKEREDAYEANETEITEDSGLKTPGEGYIYIL
jgi:hypothetical protein